MRLAPCLRVVGGGVSRIEILLIFVLAAIAGCRHAPLPLDPLTPTEQQAAEHIARADAGVIQALGGGRIGLAYVAFLHLKPENRRDGQRAAPERAAEVVLYAFDGNVGARAIVNLARQNVVSVHRLKGSEVPLTPEEWTNALQLALRSQQIIGLLGLDIAGFQKLNQRTSDNANFDHNAVRALLVASRDPKDPCFEDRCVELFFRKGRTLLMESAMVNLSRSKVELKKGETRP